MNVKWESLQLAEYISIQQEQDKEEDVFKFGKYFARLLSRQPPPRKSPHQSFNLGKPIIEPDLRV